MCIRDSFTSNIEDMFIVRLLEVTQFFRMLPFKCLAGDFDKAKYFYVHALDLAGEIL